MIGHVVRRQAGKTRRPLPHYAERLAKVLKGGEFVPNRPGSLGSGYELWARHRETADVMLHCGGNAGWFDWFTPVGLGEAHAFTVAIEGRAYRLVRGVDAVPAIFEQVIAVAQPHARQVRRPQPRMVRPTQPPDRRGPLGDLGERPFAIEVRRDSGAWEEIDRCRTEWGASSTAASMQDKYRVPFRTMRAGQVVRVFGLLEAIRAEIATAPAVEVQ